MQYHDIESRSEIVHRSFWIKSKNGYRMTLCGIESFDVLKTDQDKDVSCVNCKALMTTD